MPHEAAPAFAHTSGPQDARVVLVAEAWGEQEDLAGRPMVGNAGQELTRLLAEAGIARHECLLTNVFQFRPYQETLGPSGKPLTVKSNSLAWLCAKKAEMPKGYSLPGLRVGTTTLYVKPEFFGEVNRLREEILAFPRHLVVALGNLACWALLGTSGISKLRGTATLSTLCPGVKVLPTYHPSYLFNSWEDRPIVLADLMKARREAEFPEIRRPERWITVNPTLDEIAAWWRTHVEGRELDLLSIDVETGAGQIKMVGVAVSPQRALVVPFVDLSQPDGCYWPTPSDELAAWAWVERFMRHPAAKVFQNGLYDLQYLLPAPCGGRVDNCDEDTMLLHHALYPELQKGLGFLGSVYTNESSWKLLRVVQHEKAEKRDE